VTLAARDRLPAGAIEIEVVEKGTSTNFRLRMLKGMPVDGVYSIQGKARVGRSEENEVFLLDPSVSRAHAIVELDGVAAVVRDLGSTNGTFVNGERIEARPLRDGDELTFGNTRMRFETE
jgi:adenylate cyclase